MIEQHELAESFYDEKTFDSMYNDCFLEEMDNYKEEACRRLSKIVHPSYVSQIAAVLSFAYCEDDPDAKKIAETFNLNNLHFYAINGWKEEFCEEMDSSLDYRMDDEGDLYDD
jgi:D-alanine-D-alanine ligase-like ATP-grasp enzyme